MKPLVTSVRAIRELATGLSPSAVSTSSVLYVHRTDAADYLIASEDEVETQRVVLMRAENVDDEFVPDGLTARRRDILSRMASFAERARSRPLSLPKGWHQYKHNNLIAFFAVPRDRGQSGRWIAEVMSNERADIIFWRFMLSDGFQLLEEFEMEPKAGLPDLATAWPDAIRSAKVHFAQVVDGGAGVHDVDILLPPSRSRPPPRGHTVNGSRRRARINVHLSTLQRQDRSVCAAPPDPARPPP